MNEKNSIMKVSLGIIIMIVGTISLFYSNHPYGLVAMLNSVVAIIFSCLIICIGFVVLSAGLGLMEKEVNP